MRYKLIKAIAAPKDEKEATPLLGYVLFDRGEEKFELVEKEKAYDLVSKYGCVNAQAKTREFEDRTIYYLKPTDCKLSDILLFS
jgi:hypothetical protein